MSETSALPSGRHPLVVICSRHTQTEEYEPVLEALFDFVASSAKLHTFCFGFNNENVHLVRPMLLSISFPPAHTHTLSLSVLPEIPLPSVPTLDDASHQAA